MLGRYFPVSLLPHHYHHQHKKKNNNNNIYHVPVYISLLTRHCMVDARPILSSLASATPTPPPCDNNNVYALSCIIFFYQYITTYKAVYGRCSASTVQSLASATPEVFWSHKKKKPNIIYLNFNIMVEPLLGIYLHPCHEGGEKEKPSISFIPQNTNLQYNFIVPVGKFIWQ